MAEFSRQLSSVEMDDFVKGLIDRTDVKTRAPDFKEMFNALLTVMTIQEDKLNAREQRENKTATKATEIPHSSPAVATSSQKRTRPDSTSSITAKRPKGAGDAQVPPPTTPTTPEQPKTPDQPTMPADPNHTSSSTESKPEPNTDKLLWILLMNTLNALEREFSNINWQRSGHKVEIAQTYVPSLPTS